LTIVIICFRKISDAFLKSSAGILSSPDACLLAILFTNRLNSRKVATGYLSLSSCHRSVGESTRLFQERSFFNHALVGTEVLGVMAIAPFMGAKVGYASARTCIFPPRGCGLLPGHRDRSCVSPYTCGEGVVCVGLEKGFRQGREGRRQEAVVTIGAMVMSIDSGVECFVW